ncbi:MAG: hypothetical protein HKN57_09250 [Xanthomonadales bacterium]|nr:hypothetical protein [Gammaproteobacteria bacterium]MBT8054042.1 hypothetical protein [Gammaproteobacteria bacterium]NND57427.1 hypothetical protein [Xanthomonadales bacterium]
MTNDVLQVSDDFWNIRGSYKIGGVIDVGTQTSLVRLASGKFVLLDCYTLSGAARRLVDDLTSGGEDIEAILNVHPFHTVHVNRVHEMYPGARLYGTARHLSKFPNLPWADLRTEDVALHEFYAEDFEFSVPRGVDFISDDENIHFSSVLVLHRASQTIHSDDTLMYLQLPGLMRMVGLGDSVSYHPTLAKALEKRAGAAADFRLWANELNDRWQDAENLCAAHTAALLARNNRGESIHARMVKALEKVEKTLKSHEEKWS